MVNNKRKSVYYIVFDMNIQVEFGFGYFFRIVELFTIFSVSPQPWSVSPKPCFSLNQTLVSLTPTLLA